MRHLSRIRFTFVIALLLVPFAAYGGGAAVVPGSSNPYLAGMPNGSTCCSGDSAPAQSPVLAVASFGVAPGATLQFFVSGSVNHTGGTPTLSPDGTSGEIASPPANNGIASFSGPIDALVGVFLDASQPDSSAAPAGLNFTGAGLGTSFATLSPGLKQVFFIGDARTGTGTGAQQSFIVPAGATRLFFGTSDGFGWFNNSGSLTVTGGAVTGATPTPTPTTTPTQPAPTATPTVPVTGAPPNVPTLSFPMLAVLSLALIGAAMFLMRRA